MLSFVWPLVARHLVMMYTHLLTWSSVLAQGMADKRPRAPPNDPERKGNIWHRYEDLESRTRQLTSANQALFAENARHQRVRPQMMAMLVHAIWGTAGFHGWHDVSLHISYLLWMNAPADKETA